MVEAEAAVQVAGVQQDPAAQNVRATIPASRCVTREVMDNAHSPADLLAVGAEATLTVLDAELGDLGAQSLSR